jgi:hypothetical protein
MIEMPLWIFIVLSVFAAIGAVAFTIFLFKLIEFIRIVKSSEKYK